MFTIADLIGGFVVTWGVGLAPALAARYLWKKAPLTGRMATLIAGLSCGFFALSFLIIRSELGEADARISPAWILVFIASRAIMMSGKRAELVRRLQAMIADPATTEAQRALAREKLGQLEKTAAKRAHAPQLTVAGGPPVEPSQLGSHPQRLAKHGSDIGNLSGDSAPVRSRMHGLARTAAYVLAGVLLLDVLLLISGYRLLVHERVVEPGDRYVTVEWVFGSDERAVLVCSYWTGRSLKPTGLKYGVGKNEIDECPLLSAQDEWN